MSASALNGDQPSDQQLIQPSSVDECDLILNGTETSSNPRDVSAPGLASDTSCDVNGHDDGPPHKKRKITDEHTPKSSSRAPSPPWKKITADGPTTFLENGRRRSGRTNVLPIEQKAQSARRQTRAAHDKLGDKRNRPSYNVKTKQMSEPSSVPKPAFGDNVPRRGPGRPPKIKVEDDQKHGIAIVHQYSDKRTETRTANNHSPSLRKRRSSRLPLGDDVQFQVKQRSPSPPLTLQKVRFRVALPKSSILTPANIPRPKQYADFRTFLERDPLEPFTGQDQLSRQQIKKEAVARLRLREVQESGRLIDERNVNALPDKQAEPQKQFAHHDHLLGHISYFRSLLTQERKEHMKKAEQLAREAKLYLEEKRKKGRVKTAEELAQEHKEKMRGQYRYVIKDMDRLWLAVQSEVNSIRLRQFEEEQQARVKSHLNRVLERADEMLTRRDDSELRSDIESGTASPTEDGSSESDSEVMSRSTSDTDSVSEQDPDENLTAEQLRVKYEALPDLEKDEDSEAVDEDRIAPASTIEDSDPDVEMDSEFDSDASDEDEGENDPEESDPESEQGGLLSLLFSKKEILSVSVPGKEPPGGIDVESSPSPVEEHQQEIAIGVPEAAAEISNEHQLDGALPMEEANANETIGTEVQSPLVMDVSQDMDIDEGLHRDTTITEPLSIVPEDLISQDMSARTSPDTSATKRSEPDSISSPEPHNDATSSEIAIKEKSHINTPVPSLLRGTLREYQHEGLDWLANLYANGRSGILADEMGLGKTIQSIALLAHLATEYEVWGPHLIVVPTSVMLNWEMEFKKFLPGFKILTYYGTLEERKQKRRGWMADDSFNVCITSYQLVLQDANSFKRRRWHYMILDEAHNIKNFRSERWQTMMTFNTRARLLLTGTPLQNNLTELWSLLFFLHYGQEGQDDDEAFAGLKEWSEWFKRPVESILEHGRQVLDAEDKEQVAKLHKVIRPFLLRRLKADVEKQMPAKYEHVEMCRLSKRQRQLYDGFMSRAQTKETLASGNYLSIINALMQLRKVCNHPDLFETRPINTSFAMSRSVVADFEIKDLLLRRKLISSDPLSDIDLDFLQLVPISKENISMIENMETVRRHAYHPLKLLRDRQCARIDRQAVSTAQQRSDILVLLENIGRKTRLQDIDRTMYYEAYRHHQRPIYGRGLLEKLDFRTTYSQLSRQSGQRTMARLWESSPPITSLELVRPIEIRSRQLEPLIQQYACVTPAVIATGLSTTLITELGVNAIRQEIAQREDPFHHARMKLSIAFPDKRLLQYDCGKLQRLARLLRQLQSGGHRALIFTQMTKVLDILEQFLNIHGHRYLRLDGATKIEQRQILTDRFNNDSRILCFILSSRSGGLGINLTGADTVIFYDLDWNPAMDRQCTDRAHRIGQTRDVHIYRFVSEHTIESNILRKANQKQLLDDVVIQEGEFTTDYMNKLSYRDMLDDQAEDDVAGAAIDRVLGNDKTAVAAFEQAEDQEDVSAAKVAAKEVQHADDGDFEDKMVTTPQTGETGTPGPFGATNTAIAETDEAAVHHIDDYLLRLQTFLLKDVPLGSARDKSKKGKRRGDDHRRRRPKK